MTAEHMNHVHKAAPKGGADQTITVTVKPEIDREAVEEAARAAAALFLSSFAVAVLDGITGDEPPEEVLARVKAETLEKAAHEHRCDTGNFDRTLCAPPCDSMHSYCATCGERQDPCAHDENPAQDGAGHDQAPSDPQPATDAPEAAQTLADLEPCLGDRVRAYRCLGIIEDFTYGHHTVGEYGWSAWLGQSVVMEAWIVLERLEPVTPEEPPVGSGMLVDGDDDLWRRTEGGWQWLNEGHWTDCAWSSIREYWRPATPADLARNGVGGDGEPVGKGEASEDHVFVKRDDVYYAIGALALREEYSIRDLRNRLYDAANAKAGDRG